MATVSTSRYGTGEPVALATSSSFLDVNPTFNYDVDPRNQNDKNQDPKQIPTFLLSKEVIFRLNEDPNMGCQKIAVGIPLLITDICCMK